MAANMFLGFSEPGNKNIPKLFDGVLGCLEAPRIDIGLYGVIRWCQEAQGIPNTENRMMLVEDTKLRYGGRKRTRTLPLTPPGAGRKNGTKT